MRSTRLVRPGPVLRTALLALPTGLMLTACTAGAPEPAPAPAATSSSAPSAGALSSGTTSGPSDPTPRVIQPGRPGQSASAVDPDLTIEPAAWNDADARFMQMMIPHHRQALEMSALAPLRARDDRVRRLAERIRAGQAPEIILMAGWLRDRELEVPAPGASMSDFDHATHDEDHGNEDHGAAGADPVGAAHGMLSEAEMNRLAAARGTRFDRLFLRGMIRHHRGAVDMAGDEGADGSDGVAQELAADVSAGQNAEILRLDGVLRDLE